MILMPPNEI